MKNIFIAGCIASFAFFGCGAGGGEEDPQVVDNSGLNVTTSCGVVSNGLLENPISTESGERITNGTAITGNLAILNGTLGPILVKLHAMAAPSKFKEAEAKSLLQSLLSSGGYFFRATPDCSVVAPGGGVGTSGQFITLSGASATEELIRQGFLQQSEGGSCAEELITGCYAALIEQAKANLPQSAGQITDFLWKPESDGGYNPGLLSILVNPCGVQVLVNGEELQNFGPGNGRCSTARSLRKSGCGYGGNARVEVIDPSSGLPYTFPDGNPYYIIPNGCSRVEFKQ